MTDVANAAGVSAMTVSRALRGSDSVSLTTRGKIMAAVEELGYVLDLSAAHLSSQRSGFISVLTPTGNNSNFNDTVEGLRQVLEAKQKQILIGNTNYSLEREEAIVQTMLQRRPEGIVIVGGVHTENTRHLLTQADIPVIETWDLPESPVSHVVGFSNTATIELMVQHLYDRGYRKIAFAGGEDAADVRGLQRRQGYESATARLGLDHRLLKPGIIPPLTMSHGAPMLDSLLDSWPETDAVICVSDLIAAGMISACHRRGIKIPQDLAICGFGDFEISRTCWPTITTVSVNSKSIGTHAGKLMLEAIASKGKDKELSAKHIVIPFEVIERESTA